MHRAVAFLLYQQFRDLDAVGGSALADLIAAAPQAQAVFIGNVGTDTAHIDDVLSGGFQRHGVLLVLQIIHQLDTGGGGEDLPCFRYRNGAVKVEFHGNGVAAHDRNADTGAGNIHFRQVHDLSALKVQLHFLAGVAVQLLAADLGNQIVGNLVGEGLCLRALSQPQVLHLLFQFRALTAVTVMMVEQLGLEMMPL